MANELRARIYECHCSRCRAVVWLIDGCNAVLQISSSRAGRLCEFAVVAASGAAGMDKEAVVAARREYARHLKVQLEGPISDADVSNHMDWAITNSNYNPSAKNRVNLGRARAFLIDGRYFIGRFFE